MHPLQSSKSNCQWLLILAGCIALSVSVGGCFKSNEPPLADGPDEGVAIKQQEISLQLNWFPEAEHGGYYAADLQGYFADEDLKVSVLAGGPNVPVVQSVAAGRVDFAVTNADRVVLGQEAGADVVALLAPIQNTPRCIMVHKESGITKLEELSNVTLAVGAGPAFFQYMKKKLPLENVQTIAYPGSIGPFVANKQFAQQGYAFSEPLLARRQGADPVVLMLSEIGYNPYASLLITRREVLQNDRELVQRVVRACHRGWSHYLQDADKTNQHIHSLNRDMDAETLAFGAKTIAELSTTDSDDAVRFGMTIQRWSQLTEQLAEIELVSLETVKPEACFDAEILAEAITSQQSAE